MNDVDATIPLPQPTKTTAAFWDACSRGELFVQKCLQCFQYVFIPEPFCPNCGTEKLEWVRSAGRGTVYSFSVVWRPQQPAFKVPYIVAIIELDEGWFMLTNILECPVDRVHIGMRVAVSFRKKSDEITLPYFCPDLRPLESGVQG
jgi:uncharacterized protein